MINLVRNKINEKRKNNLQDIIEEKGYDKTDNHEYLLMEKRMLRDKHALADRKYSKSASTFWQTLCLSSFATLGAFISPILLYDYEKKEAELLLKNEHVQNLMEITGAQNLDQLNYYADIMLGNVKNGVGSFGHTPEELADMLYGYQSICDSVFQTIEDLALTLAGQSALVAAGISACVIGAATLNVLRNKQKAKELQELCEYVEKREFEIM